MSERDFDRDRIAALLVEIRLLNKEVCHWSDLAIVRDRAYQQLQRSRWVQVGGWLGLLPRAEHTERNTP